MTQALPPGFYTTFSTLAGGTRVLGLKFHLQRLYVPAREVGTHPALDETALRQCVAEVAKENLPKESRLRLILTREKGDIYAGVEPFEPLPKAVYENGVRVITAEMRRHDPHIKSTDFIAKSAEERKQVTGNIYEVLLTKNGRIFEGLTSNFYAVKHVIASAAKQSLSSGGVLLQEGRCPCNHMAVLVTARYGILLGVTRRAVLRLARGEGMSIEYRAPSLIEEFSEAFLTSSSRGIVPIVSIDNQAVGEGRVGTWTKRLMKAYREYVERKADEIVSSNIIFSC